MDIGLSSSGNQFESLRLFSTDTNVNVPPQILLNPLQDPSLRGEVDRVMSMFGYPFSQAVSLLNHSPYNGMSLKVETDQGDYLLRIGNGWRTKDKAEVLQGMDAFYRTMQGHSVPSSQFIPTAEGNIIARVGAENGNNCTLSPWIESEGRFTGGTQQSYQLGFRLGQMHKALLNVEGVDREKILAACQVNEGNPPGSMPTARFVLWDELKSKVFDAAAAAPPSEHSSLLAECCVDFERGYRILEKLGFTPEQLDSERLILHGDPIAQNLLVVSRDDGIEIVILDPEKICVGWRYFDIGPALLTALRQSAEFFPSEYASDIAKAFVSGYELNGGEIDMPKAASAAILRTIQNMRIYGENLASASGRTRLAASEVLWQAPGYCMAMRETLQLLELQD